jgi:hypothetical protein
MYETTIVYSMLAVDLDVYQQNDVVPVDQLIG